MRRCSDCGRVEEGRGANVVRQQLGDTDERAAGRIESLRLEPPVHHIQHDAEVAAVDRRIHGVRIDLQHSHGLLGGVVQAAEEDAASIRAAGAAAVEEVSAVGQEERKPV